MIKFVVDKSGQNECVKCCFVFMSKDCRANECHADYRDDKKTGHFVNVKRTRPRIGKHERLLRALLKVCDIDDSALDGKGLLYRGRRVMVSDRTEKQLVSIKEAMEKKGGTK